MAGVIRHRKDLGSKADGTDSSKVRASDWGSDNTDYDANPTHTFTGGSDGDVLVRDTGESDGAAFRALVADDIPQLAYSSLSGLPTLGDAAALDVGTSAGTVAAGDHLQSVAAGGTGFASYTVGDLLYASAATTLAKLADVATGSVLVSGGVGVAPAWSASPTVTSLLTGGGASGTPSVAVGEAGTGLSVSVSGQLGFSTSGIERMRLLGGGLVAHLLLRQDVASYQMGVSQDVRIARAAAGVVSLSDDGATGVRLGFATDGTLAVQNFAGSAGALVSAANLTLSNVPTANPNIAGRLWNDSGTLKISAG